MENSQNNALAKLPMLKLGEYEMWEIRIKQYFQIQDYALWEVIENGNSWVPIPVTSLAETTGTSTGTKMTVPSTAEEKTCKKNDVKARSLLLMALPNEHQLTFDQYVDAQSMFAAIKARFGGNEATKKTQKALLKQQYENFSASSSESLDSIFNRLQRLVSRLAILGVVTPPEDLNVNFLRSLPSEWDTHVVVWMNKPDFDTMGLDDLYNNFKIVEQKVKKFAGASNDDKNLAFVTTSGASSTNNINTVNPEVSTATTKVNTASTEISTASFSDATVYAFLSTQPKGSQLVHEDLEQLHDDDLEEMDLKWNMALLSMRARKFYQRTGRKIIIDGSNTAGYDKSKVECFNCHRMGHFARECRAPRAPRSKDNKNWNQGSSTKTVKIEDASEKAMCAIYGVGFDWSDMAEEEIQENMALMAFSDSEVTNDKSCFKSCLKNYEALKKQYDDLLVKLDDTGFKAATYKRGLATLEDQIVKYREHEVLFSEEIALLKRSVGHKEYQLGLLRTELEKVKQEKEGFEFKIAKFDKSAKDLEQLLGSQITDKSKKGFGYNAVPSPHPLILNRPTPLDLSYSGLEEFKEPEVNEYGPRDSSLKPTIGCDKESDNSKENTDDSLEQHQITDTETSSVKSSLKVDKDWKEKFFYPANHVREVEPKKVRENNDAPIIEDWVSDDEDDDEPNPKVEKKTVIPTATKKEYVKPEKPVKRSVRYAEMYRSQRPRGNQRNWNGQKSNQLGCNFVFNNKACFNCGSFDHIQYSCPNQQRKRIVSGNNYNKKDNDYYSKTSHSSAHKHMAPRAVLMKTGLKSVNTARPVNTVRSVNTGRPFSTARSFNTVRPSYTAHPKSTIHCARPRTYFQNQAQSTVHRPFYKRTTLTKRCFNQRFNTGRPFRSTVNTVRARVDGKKIIINESTVRRDLQLEDAEGVDCLPNATIFEQLALMREPKKKDTQIPQSSVPSDNVVDEVIYKELDDSLVRAATTDSSLEAEHDSGGSPRRQETIGDTIAQTRFKNVTKLSNDPLLARGNTLRSGEDSLKLNELMELCTNLQQRVLDLETTKTTQSNEIASLKRRGRRIHDIDVDEYITLVNDPDDADIYFGSKALAALKSVNPGKSNVVEEPSVHVSAANQREETLQGERNKSLMLLTKEWDDIQAKVDVDYQLAQKL
ncbi:putative ribonuclease H-like domain-containing protein [Tanacetum coccineum]|uniref:Ribonuclease H-like domain-containing protein n=1 Tax=Tanacetum coccineum TaxID=301880 RepID=A0ABQ5DYG9_9ASTR